MSKQEELETWAAAFINVIWPRNPWELVVGKEAVTEMLVQQVSALLAKQAESARLEPPQV